MLHWKGFSHCKVNSWWFFDKNAGNKSENWAEQKDLTDSVIVHKSFTSIGLHVSNASVQVEVEGPADLEDGWEEEDLAGVESLIKSVEDNKLGNGVQKWDSHVVEWDEDLSGWKVVFVVNESRICQIVHASVKESINKNVVPEFLEGWWEDGSVGDDEEGDEETSEGGSGGWSVEASESYDGEDHGWQVEEHALSSHGPFDGDEWAGVCVDSAPRSDFVDEVTGESVCEEKPEFDEEDEHSEDSDTGGAFIVGRVRLAPDWSGVGLSLHDAVLNCKLNKKWWIECILGSMYSSN